MPAPNISGGGFTSFVTNAGNRLYEMIALQQKAELEAAARAETARQQRVKEAMESAKAGRESQQLYLQQLAELRQREAMENTEEQNVWERNNPSLMNVQTVDENGNPVNALVGQRGGKEFGRMAGYRAPDLQVVKDIPGPGGTVTQQLRDMARGGKVLETMGQYKPPVTGNEGTWGQPVEMQIGGRNVVGRFNSKGGFMELPGMQLPEDADKSPTEYMGKALFNYQLIAPGNALMDAALAEGVPEADLLKIYAIQDRSELVASLASSDAGKKFIEGARYFVEGMGRSVSGAAITDPEWARFKLMAMPMPGSTPDIHQSKMRFRKQIEDTAAVQSGRAYKMQYGHDYVSPNRAPIVWETGPNGQVRRAQGR